MCDTFVALSNSTQDGSIIFGKNSDREANEAHEVVLFPAIQHSPGEILRCTYIDIPQVLETNSVLLSKPFWIWGAEMGANQHGVVIGNEAIFSKVPASKKPGLIGMDFLRLALERASTALESVKVITQLLETYGQSGNCGFTHPLYYHNSYLIADSNEAWVLETVDQHWAAQKVKDFCSISNGLSIENEFDIASSDLISYAVKKRWCKGKADFSFKRCYSDLIMTFGSDAKNRKCRTTQLLSKAKGSLNPQKAMQILRDHGDVINGDWSPDKKLMGATVCMHQSSGPVRISQTTGSMISHIQGRNITHWLTGTAAPCTSIYKPVWLESGLPEKGVEPTGIYDHNALFWKHEDLHRLILNDYANRIKYFQPFRDKLEAEFMDGAKTINKSSQEERKAFSQECWEKAFNLTCQTIETLIHTQVSIRRNRLHQLAWKKLDKQAQRQAYN